MSWTLFFWRDLSLAHIFEHVSYFRASNAREQFDFRSRILCFETDNEKKLTLFENPMTPELFVCRAKVLRRLKEEKSALGTRMKISQSKILGF